MREAANYPLEPHFDEESTLLSARPVVLLEDIKASVRYRRRLVLTGGLTFAVLLGACAALLISYIEQRQVETFAAYKSQPADTQPNENESQQVESSALEDNTAFRLPNDSPAIAKSEHEQTSAVITSKPAASRQRPLPHAADSRFSKNLSKAEASMNAYDDENALELNDRETRRLGRWEERRLRRETFRDRRATDRDSGDGLFRIREIFEGTRKPR